MIAHEPSSQDPWEFTPPLAFLPNKSFNSPLHIDNVDVQSLWSAHWRLTFASEDVLSQNIEITFISSAISTDQISGQNSGSNRPPSPLDMLHLGGYPA